MQLTVLMSLGTLQMYKVDKGDSVTGGTNLSAPEIIFWMNSIHLSLH